MDKTTGLGISGKSHAANPTVRSSLATKLLRLVLSIYFIVAITTTIVQLVLEYGNEKNRLATEIGHIAKTFEPIFAQAVWNLDDEQIQSSLSGVLINTDVLGAKLSDENHKVIASVGLVRKSDNRVVRVVDGQEAQVQFHGQRKFSTFFEFDREVVFESPYRGRQVVGYLTLYTSSDIVLERATYTFFITIVNAFIKTFFLWVIFSIILNRLVAMPLGQLTQAMNRLNPDAEQDDEPKEIIDPRLMDKDDELGILVRTFKSMKYSLLRKNRELHDNQLYLEQKVEERTVKLEKASLAKSEFLANMSHEIRTPMNGVLGMTELLRDTSLTEKQLQYTNTIQSSAQALLGIINDVLDYSKIEAGKMDLESIRFNLENLIDDCVAIFAFKAGESHVELVSSIKPDCPRWLVGDPTRLRQILMNLLSNAFKFTERGEVLLNVIPEQETEDGILIKFVVQDTGIGLSKPQKDRLFQSFTQADSSTTRKYGGTGLGLAISKQLCELMDGQINVDSVEGHGATFTFTARFLKADSVKEEPAADLQILQGKRLLVVDDHGPFNDMIVEVTDSWQMLTEVAETGRQGLTQLHTAYDQGQPFDLVLLDLNLPDSNGLALAREISMEKNVGSPKLLLVSATRSLPNGVQLESTGLCATLEKPLPARDLRNALAKAMGVEHRSEPERSSSQTSLFATLRVLVAEDNTVNQMVIKGLLRKLGIEPQIACNGLEAIDHFTQATEPFDVVLMDCEMPELDGWEATKQIRHKARDRDTGEPVVIIALSAHALSSERHRADLVGMDDYLSKPVSMQDLEEVFKRHLNMQDQ